MMTIRNKCVICDSSKLKEQMRISNFPVYMGVSDTPGKKETANLIYLSCESCGCVQLKTLIPLDVLYERNHNVEVVGKLWHDHNKAFVNFMTLTNPIEVVEIGDPHYKMARAADGIIDYNSWTIIEPCLPKTWPEHVRYIPSVIDKDFNTSQFNNIDTVVLSHSLEHMYEPRLILNKIRDILHGNDRVKYLYISIPNFDRICTSNFMPPLGMHFEHSFLCSDKYINMLFNLTGFYIDDVQLFKDHSVFYRCIRSDHKYVMSRFDTTIKNIGMIVLDKNVFLYGAHFPAQFILNYYELSEDKFIGVLDNAKSKQGKYLYGTNLRVYAPEEVAKYKDVQVIVKMGPYTEEIKYRLLTINPNVRFI